MIVLMKIKVQHVYYMPKVLEPGVLYVSKEFKTAAHLCACGCGAKIRTPLTPTEWSLEETGKAPTLRPSVGNWQQACKSHYWIYRGEIRWDYEWSLEQIEMGRRFEEERRRSYYQKLENKNGGMMRRFWNWFRRFLK